MPELSGSDVRYIKPRSMAAGVEATSTSTDTVVASARCTTATGPPRVHASASASATSIEYGCTLDLRGISERMLNAMAFTVVLVAGLGLFLSPFWRNIKPAGSASRHFTLDF